MKIIFFVLPSRYHENLSHFIPLKVFVVIYHTPWRGFEGSRYGFIYTSVTLLSGVYPFF